MLPIPPSFLTVIRVTLKAPPAVSNTELVTCVRHVETARFYGNGTETARLRSQTQVSPTFKHKG
jgi:hypothetical protein